MRRTSTSSIQKQFLTSRITVGMKRNALPAATAPNDIRTWCHTPEVSFAARSRTAVRVTPCTDCEMSVPVATSTSTGMPSTSHPSSTPDSAMQATSLSMPRSRQMRNDSSAQHGSPAAAMRGVTRMPRLP